MHLLIRFFIGLIEWFLRKTVLNNNLEEVEKVIENISYGDDPKQSFDLIVPINSDQCPILFYFHGGGWITGDKSNFNWVCYKFAHSGMLVFNINYRLSPENKFPEPLKDVSSAIQAGLTYAEKYGGDPSRVYIAGDSAGAHLASWYVTALGKPELLKKANLQPVIALEKLKGCLLFYGIYDLETAKKIDHIIIKNSLICFLGKSPDLETINHASPFHHVDSKLPPLFLCAGEPDILYDQTKEYSEILKQAEVECTSILFTREKNPESNHSFINFGNRNCSQIAMQEAVYFISKTCEN